MRLRYLIISLTFCTLLLACKDKNNSPAVAENESSEPATAAAEETAVTLPTYVYPWVDQLRIRATPGATGTVLAKLKENEPLEYLNEETMEQYEVTLRGRTVKAPWIKVKTANGTTGWIFGGATTTQSPAQDQSASPFDDCYQKNGKRWRQNNDCIASVARQQFRGNQQFVRERNGAYLLTLLDGTFKVFAVEDAPSAEQLISYDYLFYLKEMGYFVLQRNFTERTDYLLVNDKSGKITPVGGLPKASPDRNYLVTLANQNDRSKIEIWELSNAGLTLAWQRELAADQAFRPWWLDNKTIQFVTQSINRPTKAADTSLLSLTETGDWEYEDRRAPEI